LNKLAAYWRIREALEVERGTVSHYLNVVDTQTDVHAQNIESLWTQLKLKIKTIEGVLINQLFSLLYGFM